MGARGVPKPLNTIFVLKAFFDQQGVANPYGFFSYLQQTGKRRRSEEESGARPPPPRLPVEAYDFSHPPQTPEEIDIRARESGAFTTEAKLEPDFPGKAYLAVSYDRVRYYFWMLNQVHAIAFDHEEPSLHGLPKRFYRKTDDAWFIRGLQQHFHPAVQLGAARYRSAVERREAPRRKIRPPDGRVNPERPYSRYWEEPPRAPEDLPHRARRRPRKERGT